MKEPVLFQEDLQYPDQKNKIANLEGCLAEDSVC